MQRTSACFIFLRKSNWVIHCQCHSKTSNHFCFQMKRVKLLWLLWSLVFREVLAANNGVGSARRGHEAADIFALRILLVSPRWCSWLLSEVRSQVDCVTLSLWLGPRLFFISVWEDSERWPVGKPAAHYTHHILVSATWDWSESWRGVNRPTLLDYWAAR